MNNNKNTLNSKSKDKDKENTETRVFARLISRAEIQKVSGAIFDGNYGDPVCKKSKNGDKVQMDCTYYPL